MAQFFAMAPVPFVPFGADMVVWHLSQLYQATLENETVHIVEHPSSIATGVINWLPILSPLLELPWLSLPAQILYLILDLVPSAVLGWFFILATTVFYPTYAAAPRVLSINGINDQLIGGYMMVMPGAMMYLGAVALLMRQRFDRSERAKAGKQ